MDVLSSREGEPRVAKGLPSSSSDLKLTKSDRIRRSEDYRDIMMKGRKMRNAPFCYPVARKYGRYPETGDICEQEGWRLLRSEQGEKKTEGIFQAQQAQTVCLYGFGYSSGSGFI